MALFEVLTLDGLTFTGDPTGTLVLETLEFPVPKARFDWIQAADSEGAALLRDPEHENREISFRLRVGQQATMDAALDQIGQVRDRLRKASLNSDGITLAYTPADSARTGTFDVLAGEIPGIPVSWSGDDVGWFLKRPVIPVTLTCKPYGRHSEITSTTASASAPIVTKEITGVPGDIPALGRLIVTDTATQNRRHVEWGIENQTYNASTGLQINSANLVTSGFSGSYPVTQSGSVNASVVRSPTLYATPTAVCGTGNQSHIGTFKVRARVRSTGQRVLWIRLAWKVGDGTLSRTPWVSPVTTGTSLDWSDTELGTIIVPAVIAGTHRWSGQIEAMTTDESVTVTVDIDYLLLIPAAEGYGRARATYAYTPGVLTARDQFTATTAGGALNARVAPAGGTWATSGATTDFTFIDSAPEVSSEAVTRATVSDTGFGRQAILGTQTPSDTEVGVDVASTYGVNTYSRDMGVLARWVDANNFVWGYVTFTTPTPVWNLSLVVVVAGAVVASATKGVAFPAASNYQLRLVISAAGTARLDALISGGVVGTREITSTVLATGGTLATGKVGIGDRNTSATAGSRYYDNFYAATPPAEPIVLYSGRTLEVRHNETVRQDAAGTYYGRPQSYRGSRFLVPPGTSRVVVKARRADTEVALDANPTDATQIQIAYTPRFLVVPRS